MLHQNPFFQVGQILLIIDGQEDQKRKYRTVVDALCNETILNEIINFETKTFSEDQNGINLATEEVKSVLSIKIADKSCKKVRKRKEKIKLFRQMLSNISIYEKKKSLNFLSGLIRKNPNNNELRQKYFLQLKSFRKAKKKFLNFSDEQKLVYLLNPASIRHVRVIGFYLKRSLELRTEVLLQHK